MWTHRVPEQVEADSQVPLAPFAVQLPYVQHCISDGPGHRPAVRVPEQELVEMQTPFRPEATQVPY